MAGVSSPSGSRAVTVSSRGGSRAVSSPAAHGPSIPSGARAISTRVAHGPSVPRADWRTGRLSSKWLTGRQYPNWLTGRQFPSGCVLVAATGRWSFPRLSPCLTAACRCWLSTGDWRSRPVRVGGFVRVWPRRRPGPSALVWRRPGPATCGRVASSESPARAPIPPRIRGGLVYGPRHILAPRSAPDPSPCLRLKAPIF